MSFLSFSLFYFWVVRCFCVFASKGEFDGFGGEQTFSFEVEEGLSYIFMAETEGRSKGGFIDVSIYFGGKIVDEDDAEAFEGVLREGYCVTRYV